MVDLGTLGGETDIQRGVFLAVEREEQLETMEKTANQSRGGPRAGEALELPATVLEMVQARSHIIPTLLCCCPLEIRAHGRGRSYSESCSGGPGQDHRGVAFGNVFSPLDATSLGPPLSSGPHCSSPRELHQPLDHSPLHPSNELPNLVMHFL